MAHCGAVEIVCSKSGQTKPVITDGYSRQAIEECVKMEVLVRGNLDLASFRLYNINILCYTRI